MSVVALPQVHDDGAVSTTLAAAANASVDAEKELGLALFGLQSLTVQLRHLATWRMAHPDDSGTLMVIRRALEHWRERNDSARLAWSAVQEATNALVRELAVTSAVCAMCGVPAPRGICNECEEDELPF